jgi:hypothetical protein
VLAIAVGVIGFLSNLAVALIGGLLIWWTANALSALRGSQIDRPECTTTARKNKP